MLPQAAHSSAIETDCDEKVSVSAEHQEINHGDQTPTDMTSLEAAKYREMCKFYCSPYNVTTKTNHSLANTTWRYGRRVDVGHLKPLPKLVKFKDIVTVEETRDYPGGYMDVDTAVREWSEKKLSNTHSPKAMPVNDFRYTNEAMRMNEKDDDKLSLSETLRSTPSDSTSETNNNSQDGDSLSTCTKSKKCKKKVKFIGIDDKKRHCGTLTRRSKKSKCVGPLQAAKPYAYIKDEKTGKLPVIYEEKGVLPPIVEKYTKHVSMRTVSHPCIVGNKYQSAAKRWRSLYDRIRPTNHMKTFTEVVYAVKARMDELKAASKVEEYSEQDDDNGKQTVKIVKTSIMQTPTVQRINANGVKMYPIDDDHYVAAECT